MPGRPRLESTSAEKGAHRMDSGWTSYFFWSTVAGVVGLAISAIFAGIYRMQRALFLVPYVTVVGCFLYGYVQFVHLDVGNLLSRNWLWGVITALLVGFFMVRNVLSQPGSPRSRGPRLFLDFVWFGIIYGAIDALFLSVFPVLLTWQAFPELVNTTVGQAGAALLALAASEFITLAYHAGYPEFRNFSLVQPAIGNGIITLAYVLSRNPISAVGSHMAMHMAAVWHGPDKTIQLPPHYRK